MSDQPEPLAAVLAEMRAAARDSFASKLVAEYEETGRLDEAPAVQALKDDDAYIASLADRIEAAANSMRDAYCALCQEKDAAYDRLLLERDRAFKFADAAPHPGSASWKVMQAAFRDTAELRSTMERIYRVACDAFNAPGRDLEASMRGALDTIIGAALLAL